MNKEFIPYEQALKFKELGFDEPCFGYWKMSDWLIEEKTRTDGYTHADQLCSAPTFSQAFRWFREKYESVVVIQPHIVGYYAKVFVSNTKVFDVIASYEEAELACLQKLIEIVKQIIMNEKSLGI
jgi:hypothetical protein